MPIDLASDISKISETNVWAPELSETRSIVLDIVTTAQKSKRSNKERLQKFAHSVANHFVNFTKCTSRRNRSRAQTRFKQNVEEYEQVLRDASNVVNKYSVQSRDRSVQTATARETEIKNLEQRLIELQRSIDFLLLQDGAKAISSSPITRNAAGIYEIGVSIGRPSTVVNSRHTIGMSIERPQTTFPPHRLENNSNAGRGLSVFGSGKDGRKSPHSPRIGISFLLSDIEPQYATSAGSDKGYRSSRTLISRLKRNEAPDLTQRIKEIKQTCFCGGYGDVYSAELTGDQVSKKVALKLLRIMGGDKQRAKAMKIFRREIGIWCSLNHVHVLPFYGTCKAPDGERLYMVSPWAEGGKALDYLQRNPHTNRGKLLYQTSSALDYLHSGKDAPPIIHGDLKADNVLVSITGDALLCDFGLSRFVEEKSQSSGSTSHGKGTVRFMAPESSPRSSKPSKESDVYAFGSLMLQIYTGKVPYSGLNEPQAMLEVAKGHTPSRPIELIVFQRGLNDNVWTLINACWNPDPRKRPTMKEILPQILLGAISV